MQATHVREPFATLGSMFRPRMHDAIVSSSAPSQRIQATAANPGSDVPTPYVVIVRDAVSATPLVYACNRIVTAAVQAAVHGCDADAGFVAVAAHSAGSCGLASALRHHAARRHTGRQRRRSGVAGHLRGCARLAEQEGGTDSLRGSQQYRLYDSSSHSPGLLALHRGGEGQAACLRLYCILPTMCCTLACWYAGWW